MAVHERLTTTRQIVFIAGPSAIGKTTLIWRLFDPTAAELRSRLRISGRFAYLDFSLSLEQMVAAVRDRDLNVGIVDWHGCVDEAIERIGKDSPEIDRRLIVLWRQFEEHWPICAGKFALQEVEEGAPYSDDAGDWRNRIRQHRQQVYEQILSHAELQPEFVDVSSNGFRLLDAMPDEWRGPAPWAEFDIREDLLPLWQEAIGLENSQEDWAYTSFTLPGFTSARASRDTAKRLQCFGLPPDLSGQTCLELACHCGAIGLELARRGATVLGLDVSEECVNVASRLTAALSLPASFQRCNLDVDQLPSGQFDIVFCAAVDCWLKNPDRLYEAVVRLTRRVCYFESNDASRHDYLRDYFRQHFAVVDEPKHHEGTGRKYFVLRKVDE